MEASTPSADAVGAQVTRILSEATVAGANVLADAEREADRQGRAELASIRRSVEERLENFRVTRDRLSELGGKTTSQLREAAARLDELPGRLPLAAASSQSSTLDRPFRATEPAEGGPPKHLLDLMQAADAIAQELDKAAREHARELELTARRESNRIVSEEPQRVGKVYDAAERHADALRRQANAVDQLLRGNKDGSETPEVNERTRTRRWNRVR